MKPSALAQRLRSRLLRQPGVTIRPKCEACQKEHDAKLFDARSGLCVFCIREYEEWLAEQRALHPDEPMPEPENDRPFLPEEDAP